MSAAAERAFERLAARFSGRRGISQGTGFGTNPGLRVKSKIFAMIVSGELVVKLPRDRVDQLVEAGEAARFDAGKGRPMKEWASVSSKHRRRWQQLADEAFELVEAGGRE